MTRGMSGDKGRGGHGKGGGGGDGKGLEMGRTGGNGKGREMGGGGGGQHSAIVQFESLVQQFISASDIHGL